MILFERDGGAGFYVRREFDHGDHIADFCAAFGDRTDPFALRTTATLEEARRIAGALSTAHEAYDEGLES